MPADQSTTTLEDAARGLSREFRLRRRAYVGINELDGTIRVFLHGRWNIAALPQTWCGWPIIWSDEHGPTVAA